jgi:hypothetical protein
VETIIQRIVIGDGDISIDLCYSPSSAGVLAKGQRNLMGSLPSGP